MINHDTKLDFDDVLLVPKRSKTASRKEVDLVRQYHFYHSSRTWTGVPICAANMDTTGTYRMSEALGEVKAITCLHKHYTTDQHIIRHNDNATQWYSMGIKQSDVGRLAEFIKRKNGDVPNLCIDVANGYTDDFVNFCAKIRSTLGDKPIIMAGNVCTPEMVQEIILHGGVDIVKVGIGPGSACTTRLKTGCGYPQLSAVMECAHAAHGLRKSHGRLGLVCADGGCRTPADVCKAFAAGADFVMLGGVLAGTDECEGEWEYEYKCVHTDQYGNFIREWWQPYPCSDQDERRKVALKFYGMSSHEAQGKYGGIQSYRASEGRVKEIKYKGPVAHAIMDILGGLRSACAYVGAARLKDMSKCAEFIRVNRTHFDQTT